MALLPVVQAQTATTATTAATATATATTAATPTPPAPVQSPATPPAPQQAPGADSVEAGRKLYISSCQRCHGINLASNGIGFDLRTFPQADKERFVRSVNNGLRAMPGWSSTLKPEQLDLLWLYIGSVNGWKPAQQQATK